MKKLLLLIFGVALGVLYADAAEFTVTYPKFWSVRDGSKTADMTLTYTTTSATECTLSQISKHNLDTRGSNVLKDWELIIPQTVENNGTTYTVTAVGDGFGYVVGSSRLEKLTKLVLPSTVTTLGDNAFRDCSSLKSLDLGGVTTVGSSCFYFITNLTSIDLSKVESIGERSFCNNDMLTSLDLASVKSIGEYSFWHWKALKEVSLSEGLAEFATGIFLDCPNAEFTLPEDSPMIIIDKVLYSKKEGTSQPEVLLRSLNATEVTLPAGLTSINGSAFSSSSTLVSFDANSQLTSIPGGFFSSCGNLVKVTGLDKVTEIGRSAFMGCSKLSDVGDMPEVVSIGKDAFDGCKALTSVPVMPKLKTLGSGAFYNCTGLTTVHLSAEITDIPFVPAEGSVSGSPFPFNKCSGITSFTIDEANPNYTAKDGVIYSKMAENSRGTGDVTLLKYALGKTDATEFTVPAGVSAVEAYAFDPLPASIKSLNIANDVTTIGKSCVNTSALTSLTLGSKVTDIGASAFNNAANLKKVTSLAVTPPVCDPCGEKNLCTTFNNRQTLHHLGMTDVYDNATITVPEQSKEAYKSAYCWTLFSNYDTLTGVDANIAESADVTYRWFDMRGIEVDAASLLPGVYVRVASDGTAEKVAVR